MVTYLMIAVEKLQLAYFEVEISNHRYQYPNWMMPIATVAWSFRSGWKIW